MHRRWYESRDLDRIDAERGGSQHAPTFLGVEVAAALSEIMAEGGMPDGDGR